MGKNRTKLQIIQEFFRAISEGCDTPAKLKETLGIHNIAINEYLELIQFIQTQPTLTIATAGKFRHLELGSVIPILSHQSKKPIKADQQKSERIKRTLDSPSDTEKFKLILESIWDWASHLPKYEDSLSEFLRLPLIQFDQKLKKSIRRISLDIFGDIEFIPNKEEFEKAVEKTIDVFRDTIGE